MLNLEIIEKKAKDKLYKKLYLKTGTAGFAFAIIMFLSLSGYSDTATVKEPVFIILTGFLNLVLSLAVLLYSSSDYFISVYKEIKNGVLDMDFPLALGILVLFIKSISDIIFQSGQLYIESFYGLVFFILLIRIFQNKVFDTLNYTNSDTSYFALTATIIKSGREAVIPLAKLKPGNRLVIKNGELIPVDSILFCGEANIDYSFATGESIPVNKVLGEIIYAGGRQFGEKIELEVLKNVSQSYINRIWNTENINKKEKQSFSDISNQAGKYFALAVLIVALISAAIRISSNPSGALDVFTAVLIIACPCALAISLPLIYGINSRIFGKNKFYLKNAGVVEKLSGINTIVFDKTGTITLNGISEIEFTGNDLNNFECALAKSLARNSTHPLSRAIYQYLKEYNDYNIKDFRELVGNGISGWILNNYVKLGSAKFISGEMKLTDFREKQNSSEVFLSINDEVKGYFNLKNSYREGLEKVITNLEKKYELHLLSGDNGNEMESVKYYFKSDKNLHFKQSPENKLNYIKALQNSGKKVLMIGDGLNDSDALKQSNVGISVSDEMSCFSPACDAVLDSDKFTDLNKYIELSSKSVKIIKATFIISFLYNIIAVSLSANGMITPLNAAILMPVSSVFIMLFCMVAAYFTAKRKKLL
jgi:Cu+-exporting ATPase